MLRKVSWTALVCLMSAACSSGSEGDPAPGTPGQSASGGASAGLSGSAGLAAGPTAGSAAGGAPGSGFSGSGGSTPGGSGGSASVIAGQGSGGVAGSGNAPSSGGGGASAGTAGSGISGMTSAGVGGSSAGAAGAPSSAGAAGNASGGNTSSAPDIPCPTGATFCSGFEGAALPAGTRFHAVGPSSENAYSFDSTQHVSGQKSFAITQGSGGFYYRALAVPVPGQNFWVRLHVRVSSVFGDGSHDSLFGPSTGGLDADVNNEALVEFSEQFDQVLLNTDDQLFQPQSKSTLSANTWHCMEAHYDGASGDVQIFADGQLIIDAKGYARRTFQSFRIGYMQYNDARAVWYDDVVVAPTRVNCE